jgi:putative peptidoglycan lipid II flippase
MLGNVASRILGMVREQVIAGLFGATGATDSFVAASAIPTVIYDLLIGGAISAALIPVFSDYAHDEEGTALSGLASSLMSLASLTLAGLLAILVLLAPWLARLVGVGFGTEQIHQTVLMIRVMLPAVLFMGLAGITTALLYSRERFTFPAFAPAAFNFGIITVGLILSRWLGVVSLVVGVLVGAALQLGIQLPGLRGMRFRFSLRLYHPDAIRIGRLYLPVALGLIVSGAGVLLDRNLASRTGEGSMTAMRFATALIQFPLGLVATALSYAVLPRLSRLALLSAGDGAGDEAAHQREYKSTLALGMKLALLAMLPATIALVALRYPIIQVLYQRGEFVARDTLRTAQAFLAYSPQLPFVAVDQLLIVAFYARKDTVTPVVVGLVGLGIYLAVALALLGPWGMPGLALANAVQNTAHTLILFALLWRTVGGLVGWGVFRLGGKALLGCGLMWAAIYVAGLIFPAPESLLGQLARLAAMGGVGMGIYLVGLVALKVEELKLLRGVITLGWRRLTA